MCEIIDFETRKTEKASSFEKECCREWEAGLDAGHTASDKLQEKGIPPSYAALSGLAEGVFLDIFANSPDNEWARELITEALDSVGKFSDR